MIKSLFLFALIATGFLVKANDLVVEEYGLPPTFDSITSAINAANPGDRIFIKNKAGNLPWVENITITKSLTLLAFNYDTFFIVQGTYTITPASPDTVTIIGMINLNGTIESSTAGPAGNRTEVRLLNCQFNSGYIEFVDANYDLTVQGCILAKGGIQYTHGSITGNSITSTGDCIDIFGESTLTADTSYIFANSLTTTTATGYALYWFSTTMYFDIRNNWVQTGNNGIYIKQTSSGASLQKIYNNSVSIESVEGASYMYGIYVSSTASTSQIDVQNNAVNYNSFYGAYGGIACTSYGGLTCAYNYVAANLQYPITVTGAYAVNLDNYTAGDFTFSDGYPDIGVNGGNPGTLFYNTDLTINSVGCYGGSFTMANFYSGGQGPSTWLTNYMFNVRTGNTIGIKAYSYSK